jgi:hypothetical protein
MSLKSSLIDIKLTNLVTLVLFVAAAKIMAFKVGISIHPAQLPDTAHLPCGST